MGDLIANSQGPSKGQVQVQDLGQSGTVTTVKGNIANQGILKPGVWRIKSADFFEWLSKHWVSRSLLPIQRKSVRLYWLKCPDW